jgi:hypothetical protein
MNDAAPRGLFGFGENVVFIADVMLPLPRRGGLSHFCPKVTELVATEVERFKSTGWALQVKREALEFLETLEIIIEAEIDETRNEVVQERLSRMRKRRTAQWVATVKDQLVAEGTATPENVSQYVYKMPAEQFMRFRANWPKLSRVDFQESGSKTDREKRL